MFNIGPMEFLVLAAVGLIVLGPDRLPGLARDAARMIRTLRELATGAHTQLRDELGPEFADLDLRSLHPRTVIQRALLGEDEDGSIRDHLRDDPMRDFMGHDPPAARPPVTRPLADGEPVPYDEDAT